MLGDVVERERELGRGDRTVKTLGVVLAAAQTAGDSRANVMELSLQILRQGRVLSIPP